MEKQITYPLVPSPSQETTVPCNQAPAYTTCHWTMPSAVMPDHQPHSIPLHLLYWRRQRHSTTAQPLSLKAFQVSKTEGQNRAMSLRLVSSVSSLIKLHKQMTTGHSVLQDEATTRSANDGHQKSSDAAPYGRRAKTSNSPLRKPEISHVFKSVFTSRLLKQ